MKKFTIACMMLMLMIAKQGFAQTNFYINASAAIPVGDYASGYNEKTCALLSNKGWGGGAGLGANLDLKLKFNIGVKGLGVFLSLDGNYNGLNAGVNNYLDDLKYQIWDEIDGYVTMEKPWYLNACAMTGVNYVFQINPKFGVFGEVGVGANFRYISDLYIVAVEDDYYSYFRASEEAYYDPKFTLAFQVGTGIEINRRFVFGVSFYHLGAARIQGCDYTSVSDGDDWDFNTDYFRFNDVTPMLIMARLGVKFGK